MSLIVISKKKTGIKRSLLQTLQSLGSEDPNLAADKKSVSHCAVVHPPTLSLLLQAPWIIVQDLFNVNI